MNSRLWGAEKVRGRQQFSFSFCLARLLASTFSTAPEASSLRAAQNIDWDGAGRGWVRCDIYPSLTFYNSSFGGSFAGKMAKRDHQLSSFSIPQPEPEEL